MDEKTLRLLDAVCEAYDLYHEPTATQTFCNLGVQHVLARMSYLKMDKMVANQMVDFMRRSQDWDRVDMGDAQDLANSGRIVVAGETGEPHGHVVIVRPGLMEYSGKWKVVAPKVSNIGGRPAGIGRTAAWAFKDVPDFFLLREGI